ncbi:hypothetical protein TRFO_05737 [Tritrichomonas foetus]|uniref:Uncharacterized protein n=1 Tax=Tritrichomonas foetus TaxID=1144522 RepID=A0A1J4K9F2_9EUKA|nr:hypothetical protein TRFO_05737 [Tritrichomonas foetus]|eukprot:OHT06077.1 hypothetical protein TRFO_05737 [Tritrichomonas foetus]
MTCYIKNVCSSRRYYQKMIRLYTAERAKQSEIEKVIRDICEDFISVVSKYMNRESFKTEMKEIISDPQKLQNFFQILMDKRLPIEQVLQILNHPVASRLTKTNISQKLFSTQKKVDTVARYDSSFLINFILKFLEIRGNPASSSDFLRIIQKNNLMSDHDFSLFCQHIDWIGDCYPWETLNGLGVPATIGWMTKQSISSYTRVEYPIGHPSRSGQEPRHTKLCNHDWVACEYQSDDSRRHTAIISQVNEMLEDIEDKHTYIDIQIVRNMNVLVYFLTKGKKCAGFTSQMVLNEMNEIYGRGGSMILALYRKNPEKFQDTIIKRLRQRAIDLRIEKINKLENFATDLERVLPPQRSKYQTAQSIKNSFPVFSAVGQTEISFDPKQIPLIGQLIDIYIDVLNLGGGVNQDFDKVKQFARIIMDKLRSPPNSPLPLSFNHAAALCAAAILTDELSLVSEIDERTKTGVKVAVEIGITSEMLHGHWRLLKIAAETIIRRKWTDGAREMSGMFFEITLAKAAHIIRTANLFIKCICQMNNDPEPDLIICNFNENTITVKSSLNPELPIFLDLTRIEQM